MVVWEGDAERRVLAWIVGGLLLYVVAFGITVGISVPLNEELAAVGDPALTAAFACLIRALTVRIVAQPWHE